MPMVSVLICSLLILGCYQLALTHTKCLPNRSEAICCERQCKEHCGINTSCWNCSRKIQNISGQCDACWFDVCNKTLYNTTSLNKTSHNEERGNNDEKIIVVLSFGFLAIATILLVLLCKNKCRAPEPTNRVVHEEHTETENVVGDIDENFHQFFGESYSRGKYKLTVQPEMNFPEVQTNITSQLNEVSHCKTNLKPKKGNVNDVFYRIPRESTSDEVAVVTVHNLFKKTSQTEEEVDGDGSEPDVAVGKVDHKPAVNNIEDSGLGDRNNEEANEICNNNKDEKKTQVQNKITEDKDGPTGEEIVNKIRLGTDNKGIRSKIKRLTSHGTKIDDQMC